MWGTIVSPAPSLPGSLITQINKSSDNIQKFVPNIPAAQNEYIENGDSSSTRADLRLDRIDYTA